MNELNNHKKSDAIKWIAVFILVAVLLVGTVASLVIGINNGKKTETPPAHTESGMLVTPDETNGAVKLSVAPLSANGGINQLSETSYTITATIQPASALQKANWSVAWKNGGSSWATGKAVTDYVTVTPTSDGALTATLNCVKAFSEQVVLTVSAAANENKKATCTVDYQQRLSVNSLSLGGTALSTDTGNFKAQYGKTHLMEIDYTLTDGTIPYLGKADYNEFICAGIAFTDEFIAAYNAGNGSQEDITRKMKRVNVSSEYQHTREVEFTDGAYGNTVFYGLFGYFRDTNMPAFRAAVNSVGEGNVFKVGIFKTDSAISNEYVECDTWYKLGLDVGTLFMATESITVDNSGVVF